MGGLRVTEELVDNFDFTKSFIYLDTSIVPNDTISSNTALSDTNYIIIDSSYNSDDGRFLFFTKGTTTFYFQFG